MSLWGDITKPFRAIYDGAKTVTVDVKNMVENVVHVAIKGVEKAINVVKGDVGKAIKLGDSAWNRIDGFINVTWRDASGIINKGIHDIGNFTTVIYQDINKLRSRVEHDIESGIEKVRKQVIDRIVHEISSVYGEIRKDVNRIDSSISHFASSFARDIYNIGERLVVLGEVLVKDIEHVSQDLAKFIINFPDLAWNIVDKYFIENFVKFFKDTIFNLHFWEDLGEWIIKIIEWIFFDS